ncbi:hypothetical protein CPC08DRAFT_712289 [Agrocybe pediades]|nr:hypothetical protein CPC08DRAFT_712289 [Agrocybe pediades]
MDVLDQFQTIFLLMGQSEGETFTQTNDMTASEDASSHSVEELLVDSERNLGYTTHGFCVIS